MPAGRPAYRSGRQGLSGFRSHSISVNCHCYCKLLLLFYQRIKRIEKTSSSRQLQYQRINRFRVISGKEDFFNNKTLEVLSS